MHYQISSGAKQSIVQTIHEESGFKTEGACAIVKDLCGKVIYLSLN